MGERISIQDQRYDDARLSGAAEGPRSRRDRDSGMVGLVPHIEQIADRLADAGFVALAPDLYHGESTKSPDQAGKMMMAMRVDQAERDLAGAIDHLAAQPEVSSRRSAPSGSAWAARSRCSLRRRIPRSAPA